MCNAEVRAMAERSKKAICNRRPFQGGCGVTCIDNHCVYFIRFSFCLLVTLVLFCKVASWLHSWERALHLDLNTRCCFFFFCCFFYVFRISKIPPHTSFIHPFIKIHSRITFQYLFLRCSLTMVLFILRAN